MGNRVNSMIFASKTSRIIAAISTNIMVISGCQINSPSDLPNLESVVVIKSSRLPSGEPWFTQFAQHTWIDVHNKGKNDWVRYEMGRLGSGVIRQHIKPAEFYENKRYDDRDVRIIKVITRDRAEEAANLLPTVTESLDVYYKENYRVWPGPNSNTLIRDIGNKIPALATKLHHNAVGKDFVTNGIIDFGITPSGRGLYLDTIITGLEIGAEPEIQLHLLGLTFGFSLFPPSINIPFIPEISWQELNSQN